jgi:DNA polymerase I-like protein with 3'-5' exonuclease and polymerase domains
LKGPLIALDLETYDPRLKTFGPGWPWKDGHVAGYAAAWCTVDPYSLTVDDLKDPESLRLFESIYLPIRHEMGDNVELAEVRKELGPIVADPDATIVMANSLYDYGWTLADGLLDWKAKLRDIQIQAPLLDDTRFSYSLDTLGRDYLGERKDESELKRAAEEYGFKNLKGDLWKLPGGRVRKYACQDAVLTLRLYLLFRQMMPDDLQTVYRLETDLVPVLYDMRKRGVRVDLDHAEQLRRKYQALEDEASERIKSLTSVHIDMWAAASVIEALEAEGVTNFPLTEKKREKSVDNTFLSALAKYDNTAGRIAETVLTLRRYNKARSTFVDGMVFGHAQNGRIHAELKALRSDEGGTVSGRFSCVMPNLQQVPGRDPELGPDLRRCFLPDNEEWAAIDFSSQEPRLATHFACQLGIPSALEFAEQWKRDPRMDAYALTAETCGIIRKDAKTIRLGILYGMGGGKLCDSLGLPYKMSTWKGREVMQAGPEGKALLEKFDRASPMDRELSRRAQRVAKERGYVRTILGRRASFPKSPTGERWFTHKALNRIIQGSAADMTKQAMLDCWKAGLTPLVSVHDELGFDLNRADALRAKEIMENAVPIEVPNVCDIEMGSSWGDSMGKSL